MYFLLQNKFNLFHQWVDKDKKINKISLKMKFILKFNQA